MEENKNSQALPTDLSSENELSFMQAAEEEESSRYSSNHDYNNQDNFSHESQNQRNQTFYEYHKPRSSNWFKRFGIPLLLVLNIIIGIVTVSSIFYLANKIEQTNLPMDGMFRANFHDGSNSPLERGQTFKFEL